MIKRFEYQIAYLENKKATPEMLISRSLDDEIKKRMSKVVEIEAPIKEQLLYKRIINSLSMQKVGSRLLPIFKEIASTLGYIKDEENGELVFHKENEDYFRPTPDSSIRYSYQIPYTEGANCVLYILENGQKNSYSKKELKALFLKELGYLKCGSKVDELFENSLKDRRIRKSGNGRIVK